MTGKQLSAADANDKMYRALYQTAFPVEEQIPYDDLIRLMEDMPLDFTAYYESGDFIGFTIVYPRKPLTWFWYFAVREELRGMGKGQRILAALIEKYKDKTCILDMESPRQACGNAAQRQRRHGFYLRNGFADTNVYRTFNGIEYTIMMRGEGTFTRQDYDDIISDLRRFWKPDNN